MVRLWHLKIYCVHVGSKPSQNTCVELKKNTNRFDAAAEDLLAIVTERDSVGRGSRQIHRWIQTQHDGQSFVEYHLFAKSRDGKQRER
ncbi:hypothetical protein CFAM422_003046 [Trichoderma lentiforme]|uniref:Uncharacterized protein n=1 Tax=Trichoderma lentiforme TaxID=1567552 RepID=A0A9P5CEL8_9HYPO|nr:hypothetical protein CFAM422_003046 [Trichoderma lentiforme]